MAAALALGAACRKADAGCVEAAERREWPRALELCGAAVERGSRGIEALHAANAAFFLGQLDQAGGYLKKVAPGVDEGGVAQCEGRIREKQGDVAGAREQFSKALALHEASRDDSAASTDAGLLAQSYLMAGEFQASFKAVKGQLGHAGASGDSYRRAVAQMALGDLLLEIGRRDEASQAYREARSLSMSAGNYELAAALDMRDARLWLGTRDFAMARIAFERARDAAEEAGSLLFQRKIALRLAMVAVSEHQPEVAGEELCRAAELLGKQGDLADRVLLYLQLAEAALELGDPGSALAALDATPPGASPDVAWWFPFLHGRALLGLGREDEAQRDFESAMRQLEALRRGISSTELKAWFLEDRREPFEESFVLHVRRGELADAALTMERAQALAFFDAVASARDSGGSQQDAAQSAEKLRAAIATLIPGDAPDANATAERRWRQDEVVLAYFEAQGGLWLLRMERGASRAFEIAPPLKELGRRVDRFLEAPDDAAAAAGLGEALLPEGALRPGDALVRIVPSEILARVPFAGLRRGGRLLVESHAFSYFPSLSALATPSRRMAARPPVVLSDPQGDLPSARAEGEEIASLLGVAAASGSQATSEALARARDAAVVHVASHAGMAAGGGWLQLANGRVSSADIVSMRLHPRLVVLASCASGAERGHSMWGGLATAFLAAGTPAVLATLRSVDDGSARELVARFYRQGGVDDPVRALAQVQRELAAQRPASAWMSFVLLGEIPVTGGKPHGEEEVGSSDGADP